MYVDFFHGVGRKRKGLFMDHGILLRHGKWSRCVSEHDTFKFVYIRITINFQIPPKKSELRTVFRRYACL